MEEKKIYLSFSKFKQYIDQGAKIIDTRNKDEYIKNHIEGSYNVQLEGNFEEQMEHLFTPQTAMVLICDRDTERTAVRRLQNIDFTENVLGYLYNGIEVYKDNMDQTKHPLQSFHNLNDNQFVEIYYLQNNNFENMEIVDLRPEYERNMNGFIQGSINVDVNELEKVVKLNTQTNQFTYSLSQRKTFKKNLLIQL
ncbi:Rhodanese-like domain [Pseudocohnilembus persalinus]|uniref:Rhodanese-like domain n=1 Tax=Pseudocohnilembus persalinus TaxID=266149 RepID=A0A0V0QW44_PSEPJ|nr:Rhodanese-like domain [Pseudocohnilembus persalinus]|eukprot:KRX06588.1 Rhodanese-like domain [Pseudocohnilembus persalinus]